MATEQILDPFVGRAVAVSILLCSRCNKPASPAYWRQVYACAQGFGVGQVGVVGPFCRRCWESYVQDLPEVTAEGLK